LFVRELIDNLTLVRRTDLNDLCVVYSSIMLCLSVFKVKPVQLTLIY